MYTIFELTSDARIDPPIQELYLLSMGLAF
jgi:hypothetical protein